MTQVVCAARVRRSDNQAFSYRTPTSRGCNYWLDFLGKAAARAIRKGDCVK